jgi:caa(3)-type oxidase subunit IV
MTAFYRRLARIAIAWGVLLALMSVSLASAYVPLGAGNLAVGLSIAAAKSLIVLCVFMGLLRASALPRIVAAIGFFMLALLFALAGVDYATRNVEPAPMQQPQQLHRGGDSR